MPIVVRQPVATDADALARINVAAWRTAYAGIVPADHLAGLSVVRSRERWQARLEGDAQGSTTFLGELDGDVAGYGTCGPYRTQQDAACEDTIGWGELWAIYTDPDLQGQGVGSAVHDAVVAVLREQPYVEAALWVLADNLPSRDWYARRGWRADGETSQYTGAGASLTEIRMRRRL